MHNYAEQRKLKGKDLAKGYHRSFKLSFDVYDLSGFKFKHCYFLFVRFSRSFNKSKN